MQHRILATLSAAAVLLTTPAIQAQETVYGSADYQFTATTVVDGLDIPWSMTWLPNGDMLVTERPGRLRIVRNGSLLAAPVEGVPAVHAEGQGGLFDVVLHPEFASNHLLYLSFAKPLENEGSTTTVIRGTFENDRLSNITTIFQAQAQGRNGHYGGRMVFDHNGYMYISSGERQAPPNGDLAAHPAQDTSNHNGVIVRLNDDGSIPSDNPFVGDRNVLNEIWSYGHRNPQGLAVHPVTGDLWEDEHGPQGGDELNLIQPGNNYGWPVIGMGVNYGPGVPIHASQSARGMERPMNFWVPSIATSGLMIYNGNLFPKWKGDAFVGGLALQLLSHVDLSDDGKSVLNEEKLLRGIGRVRDIREGPDGAIYLAVEGRGIVRLAPAN